MTTQQAQRIVDQAFATQAAAERIETAKQQATRKTMDLHELLEWYGADLEVAIARNDVVLFWTTVKRLRERVGA